MNISYLPPGSSGGWQTLMDDTAGGTCEQYNPRSEISVQDAPLAVLPGQVSSSFKNPYGNVRENLSFEISQGYADAPTANNAKLALKLALLTSKNHLRVIIGSSITYFPNAICRGFDADVSGQTVVYKLQFAADLETTSAPS